MKGGGNITTERERQLPEENVFDPQVAEWSLQRECRGWTKLYHHNEGRVAGSDFTLLYLLTLSTGVVTDKEEPHRDDGPFRLPPIVIAIALFNNGSKKATTH